MTTVMTFEQFCEMPWESTLCFTGHRPDKLPDGAVLHGLNLTIYYYIRRAIERGYTTFLTGMADGIDFTAAYYALHLRRTNPILRVIGIQPCSRGYEEYFRRSGYSVPHLRLLQQNVDGLVTLSGAAWDPKVYYRRNRLLVDHASGILAVCDDGRSGSMMTYQYARQKGLAYCRIYPQPAEPEIPVPENWPAERDGL